jgi:hypothetical protein
MPASVVIHVNGRALHAREDVTVAAALVTAGVWGFRRSVTGEIRGPVCGMGVCHECHVTIDGITHRRACLEPVIAGIEVILDD